MGVCYSHGDWLVVVSWGIQMARSITVLDVNWGPRSSLLFFLCSSQQLPAFFLWIMTELNHITHAYGYNSSVRKELPLGESRRLGALVWNEPTTADELIKHIVASEICSTLISVFEIHMNPFTGDHNFTSPAALVFQLAYSLLPSFSSAWLGMSLSYLSPPTISNYMKSPTSSTLCENSHQTCRFQSPLATTSRRWIDR